MIFKQIVICLVFAFVYEVSSYAQKKSCNDCTPLASCPEAMQLVKNRDSESDEILRNGFCGFDQNKLPMLCCSALTSNTNLDQHPNLALLPEKCGVINGNRIVGGTTAGIYEFPWMVLISYKTRLGLQFECGGTLINERYVLTAAHCIANLKIAGVRIGEHDIRSDVDCQGEPPNLICESKIQDIRVEEAISHPDYHGKPKVRNDIGLLRLKKPVDFSFKNADAICLPITNSLQNRNVGGSNGTVAGWGYTEKGYISPKLLKVIVPIYTHDSCQGLYNRGHSAGEENETENKFCAGEVGKDSCGGDSGGPLMVKDVYNGGHRFIQYGIVSYGPRLCGSDFPGVYTDITKYVKWILDNIKP